MDSGYLEPGETMEDDYDFGQTLLPEEIIGIIDQLLCHEVCNQICPMGNCTNLLDGMAYGISTRSNNFY
jgi:hypothetical protein